jgi:16S rRNA (guanine966-N2)-methyltransferase
MNRDIGFEACRTTHGLPPRFFADARYHDGMKKQTRSGQSGGDSAGDRGPAKPKSANLKSGGPKPRDRKARGGGGKRARAVGESTRAGGGPTGPAPVPKTALQKETAKNVKLRIIAGDMRGRLIAYHGKSFTRPMKDTVRESLFNILGKSIRGTIAIDLFSGTGALAFESISRGSVIAKAVEKDRMAAEQIRTNAVALAVEDRMQILCGDTFRMGAGLLAAPEDDTPWVVYFCPPYEMWDSMTEKLFAMIQTSIDHAPPGSRIVVETDKSFDCQTLPGDGWDLREYGNTRLGIFQPAMVCGLAEA